MGTQEGGFTCGSFFPTTICLRVEKHMYIVRIEHRSDLQPKKLLYPLHHGLQTYLWPG